MRATGRTQRLIENVVKAVLNGEPHLTVVGWSANFAQTTLRQRTIQELAKRDLTPENASRRSITVNSTTIDFIGAQATSPDKLRGSRTRIFEDSSIWEVDR